MQKARRGIKTIVEGAFHESPERITYQGFSWSIPANARLLKIDNHHKYLLYGIGQNTAGFEVVRNHYHDGKPFELEEIGRIKGGWPIQSLEQGIRFIFDSCRSFITRDGRIYVSATYFHQDWDWYLRAIPTILQDCMQVFNSETDVVSLNAKNKRIQ